MENASQNVLKLDQLQEKVPRRNPGDEESIVNSMKTRVSATEAKMKKRDDLLRKIF